MGVGWVGGVWGGGGEGEGGREEGGGVGRHVPVDTTPLHLCVQGPKK